MMMTQCHTLKNSQRSNKEAPTEMWGFFT